MSAFTRSAFALVLAVGALTSPANAQRGGGGNRQRRPDMQESAQGNFGPLPVPPALTAVALDRAKDLELTDAQKTSVEALHTSQDSANAPLRARLDSLRPTRMSAGGPNDMSQDMRDEMEARQRQIRIVMEGFKSSNDDARGKLNTLLNGDQQKKLKDYEEEEQKKFDDELRRRSRGGDRGNMGGGRRPLEV
jgi:hypothetical protein